MSIICKSTLTALLLSATLAAADSTNSEVTYKIPSQNGFNHQFGPRIFGEVLQVTAAPDSGVTLSNCHVDNPTPLGWVGVNPFFCMMPSKIFAGEHSGTFSGTYGKSGGGGPPPTWNGQARNTQVAIRHRALSPTPSNQDRLKFGIMEEVVFFTDPAVTVDWYVDHPGCTLSTKRGTNVLVSLPFDQCSVGISAQYNYKSIDTTITVIQPILAEITASFNNGTGFVLHERGSPGAGFIGHPIKLYPADVSFYNIKVYEGTCAGSGSGAFAGLNGKVHNASSGKLPVDYDNTIYAMDKIRTLGATNQGTLSGIFSWPIPWRVTSADETKDAYAFITEHLCISDNAGTARQTKGGGSATFDLNDPTFVD